MRRAQRGFSAVETLVVLTVIGIVLLVALPSFAREAARARTSAAARRLATALHMQRWESVAERRTRGLFFERRPDRWIWWVVVDGNGNGLRTAEVHDGTDRRESGPHSLRDGSHRVDLGLLPHTPIPTIPPRRGTLAAGSDPVRFGASDLVSFSPLGRSSSGTLYVSDGENEVYGVRLFGPTARVRIWRLDPVSGRWRR